MDFNEDCNCGLLRRSASHFTSIYNKSLKSTDDLVAINSRLKRAHGQMGAVIRMLEEGRSCEDIVTQMAAVSKAINTAAFSLISSCKASK